MSIEVVCTRNIGLLWPEDPMLAGCHNRALIWHEEVAVVTGVELIVAALAAGAAAGITGVTSDAIRDAYNGLRQSLRRRLASGGSDAVRALDAHETEPGVWRARLGDDLTDSGADRDEEVLAAAREVLALLESTDAPRHTVNVRDAKGVQVGNHNTQKNRFS